MELRHLKTFKAVVDAGGFRKAAEHLGYAQSTITSHIQLLEEELESPLFDRLGKKTILTETGRRFLPYAIQFLKLYEKAKEIREDDECPTGTLTIAAPESLTVYRLPPVIHEYKQRYPQVEMVLKPSPNREALSRLRTGETDLVFLLESEWKDPDLVIKKLVDEPMVLITPPDHRFREISTSTLPALVEETFLYTEQGCSYRMLFEDYLQKNGIAPKTSVESWSVEAIKQCVMCGLGISLLPRIAVQSEIEEGKLAGIPWKEPHSVATVMAYHKDKWLSPALKAFLQMVNQHAIRW
ncbi:DNA-binding transcriptional LysR family regulator [Melghirimyces profundicolus]|uniref:DNA-binding transcriptional LysR family regulator n=1 Tax=Melghirimyces profundicolus TaxID=1242148 RepID=A0A2T6BXK4_9BACL|nr:LysR family transcriptional regulator [Melghirimyces profundicolus]PTX60804.1 DNA-binding transcriptional LysR family regulator [Melghirimyces profundicolus]